MGQRTADDADEFEDRLDELFDREPTGAKPNVN